MGITADRFDETLNGYGGITPFDKHLNPSECSPGPAHETRQLLLSDEMSSSTPHLGVQALLFDATYIPVFVHEAKQRDPARYSPAHDRTHAVPEEAKNHRGHSW